MGEGARNVDIGARADEASRTCCEKLREAFNLGGVDAPDRWASGASPEGPDEAAWATTIGMEVEVPWRAYFPRLWEEFGLSRGFAALSPAEAVALTEACALEEKELLPRLRLSQACGVPRGNDRYWEFAFDPCQDWRLPCAQAELLSAAGLLPRDGEGSLQVTLGGIRAGAGAQALARLLEALSSSPGRIEAGLREASRGCIIHQYVQL